MSKSVEPMKESLAGHARRLVCALVLALAAAQPALAQQRADMEFRPSVARPAYGEGTGPVVAIDQAHHNFHTADGRFAPFAELLRRDGYQVESSADPFTPGSLENVDVLVIANALAEQSVRRPVLPTFSAFSPDEITAVRDWVEGGGALLLIADHMPWAGSAASLADAFGFLFADGFLFKENGQGEFAFETGDGSLSDHPILHGRDPGEEVDSVMSFTGQAFRVRPGVEAGRLMVVQDDTVLLMPIQAWQFSKQTPRLNGAGMLQGATVEPGDGRVAAFGEAGMFSAQISANGKPMGMNHPDAGQNAQFVLNVLHWLSGLL